MNYIDNNSNNNNNNIPAWYLYLVVVDWLACLNDPESYAGAAVALLPGGIILVQMCKSDFRLKSNKQIFPCVLSFVKKK